MGLWAVFPLFETDYTSTVGLHDEFVVVEIAILKFVWHLRLEVQDVVKAPLLKVPNVDDAGMLLCAYAYGDEHLVLDDAGSLAYVVAGEP